MILDLLKHQYKKAARSASFERELIVNIIIVIFLIYMLVNLVVLAFALPNLLRTSDAGPLGTLNNILFYYFISELVMRYFIQASPSLDLEPYLHLPIRKKKISVFLQLKSLIHPLNVLAGLLTAPFAFSFVAVEYSLVQALSWWLSIVVVSWALHFIMLIFRKRWEDSFLVWAFLVLLAGASYLLSYYEMINPAAAIGTFFSNIVDTPLLCSIPLFIAVALFYSSYKYFKDNLYLEVAGTGKTKAGERYSSSLSFLSTYGITGDLILQEIKLIVRHKRSRMFLFMSPIFLLYGLIFLDDYTGGFSPVLIFLGVIISGIFAFNYGQLLWGWKTNLLDFYFTRPFGLEAIVKSQYRLLTVSSLIFGLLSIPYLYFGWEVLLVFLACMFFNIGINIPMVMALSMWKPSALDINKSAFMNYQGVGPAQWLMMLPVIGLPYGIFFIIKWLSNPLIAVITIALFGLIAMLNYKLIITLLTGRLRKEKYILVKSLNI